MRASDSRASAQYGPLQMDMNLADPLGSRFFDLTLDMCCVAGLDGYFKKINTAFESTLGYTADELLARPFIDYVHPDDVQATMAEMEKLADGALTLYFENRYQCKDGSYKWLAWKSAPYVSDGLIYAIARDMTLVKQAEEAIKTQNERLEAAVELRTCELNQAVSQLEVELHKRTEAEALSRRQVKRLESLRKIDRAIASSTDVQVVMEVLLDQVTSRLEVDAAAVFLSAGNGRLDLVAERGFESDCLRNTATKSNERMADVCVRGRKMHLVHDLDSCANFHRNELAKAERFVFYCGLPLVAKGEVKGLIEVYHRSPHSAGADWVSFLETLAGQGAVGIENTLLAASLESSKIDLQVAYDATLEGWVRALDLRDNETEGHTQRVTSLTVALARRIGIPEEDIDDVRRGALLHDIGKIGVPDRILLKPGPLTDEERMEMERHPVYAFEWLSPVSYLRGALDIPYCHHEKYDGSGYPRGLSGTAIPLTARLFAIVDVWDALSHDRVYREAWPQMKVRAFVRQQAGAHFDPEIAETFLRMLEEDPGLSSLSAAA